MSILRKSAVVFVMLGLSSFAVAQNAPGSAVGHWRLNVEKSDYGSNPKPKSATLNITSDSAESLKWTATVTNGDGKKETYAYSGAEDGQQHPVTGDNPWKTAAYTRGDSGVTGESVVLKDGTTLNGDISMSDDGNTMTVKGSGNAPSEVWERAKSSTKKTH